MLGMASAPSPEPPEPTQRRMWQAASLAACSAALGGGFHAFAATAAYSSSGLGVTASSPDQETFAQRLTTEVRPSVSAGSHESSRTYDYAQAGGTLASGVAAGASLALAARPARSTRGGIGSACRRPMGRKQSSGGGASRASRTAASSSQSGGGGAGSMPKIWKAGPVQILTGHAQKALYILKNNPELYSCTIETEMKNVMQLRQDKQEQMDKEGKSSASDSEETISLQARAREIEEENLLRLAAELIYLQVCVKFKDKKLSLMPSVLQGQVKVGPIDMNVLTGLISSDAIELVETHLKRITEPAGLPDINSADIHRAMINISVFQAGQVYAISATFGYLLRRVDERVQLEKQLLAASGESAPSQPVEENLFDDDPSDAGGYTEMNSVKEFLNRFSYNEVTEMSSMESAEAQLTMEIQLLGLFGDLLDLKSKFFAAMGEPSSPEEANERMTEALKKREVAVMGLTYFQMRSFILEAVLFGCFLRDAEKEFEGLCDLTPSQGRGILGDDDFNPPVLP